MKKEDKDRKMNDDKESDIESEISISDSIASTNSYTRHKITVEEIDNFIENEKNNSKENPKDMHEKINDEEIDEEIDEEMSETSEDIVSLPSSSSYNSFKEELSDNASSSDSSDSSPVESEDESDASDASDASSEYLFEYDEYDEKYDELIEKYSSVNTEEDDMEFFHNLSEDKKKLILEKTESIYKLNGSETPLRFKIIESHMDMKTKAIALNNIDKLSEMDVSTGEHSKMDHWINGLIKIPFGKLTRLPIEPAASDEEKNEYLRETYSTLNKAIYGHTEAKTHILQVIGKWIKNPDSGGNVLAIQGLNVSAGSSDFLILFMTHFCHFV